MTPENAPTPQDNPESRYATMEIVRCSALLPIGATVEMGSDVMRTFRGDAVTVITAEQLTALANGEPLPVASNSINAIMVYDHLHHCPNPTALFAEIERILAPHGKAILTAPAITPLSWLCYKLAGKKLDIHENPFTPHPTTGTTQQGKNYWMPTLLFWFQEHRITFNKQFPKLRLTNRQWTGFITYAPAKFPNWLTITDRTYGKLFTAERYLRPFLGRTLSPKCRITLEKRADF